MRRVFRRISAALPCLALASIVLAGCTMHTRTITSEPPGGVVFGGPSAAFMQPETPHTTPVSFTARRWEARCFKVVKVGFYDSAVQCLPDGAVDQSAHFVLGENREDMLQPRSTPPAYAAPKLALSTAQAEEQTRAHAIRVPPSQRIATQKLVFAVDRIMDSMQDYYISSLGTAGSGGVLRKDADRYDDALVAAKGEVPDTVIVYVEEAFSTFRKSPGSTDPDVSTRARAKRNAMLLIGK